MAFEQRVGSPELGEDFVVGHHLEAAIRLRGGAFNSHDILSGLRL